MHVQTAPFLPSALRVSESSPASVLCSSLALRLFVRTIGASKEQRRLQYLQRGAVAVTGCPAEAQEEIPLIIVPFAGTGEHSPKVTDH